MEFIIHSGTQCATCFFITNPYSIFSGASSRTASTYCAPHRHSSSNTAVVESHPQQSDGKSSLPPKKFTYYRATPSTRWPHTNYKGISLLAASVKLQLPNFEYRTNPSPKSVGLESDETISMTEMNKLATKRDKDWSERCSSLRDQILNLGDHQTVSEVLDDQKTLLSSSDYCHLVKLLGQESWQRALDVFLWLNSTQWYSPCSQMLSTIIAVMGRNNQEAIALKIFDDEETNSQHTVQVYNAMMSVYARSGKYSKVLRLFDQMQRREFTPDLVSFNTLINARLKSKEGMPPNSGLKLLEDMRASGAQPDVITYNTLISHFSRCSSSNEAITIFNDMEANQCKPNLWTYNAMISVYSRCGMANKAEKIVKGLEVKGFFADSVTYNSLLYAFAREGDLEKVKAISDEMLKKGFTKDETTFNTLIQMHGKLNQIDLALDLFRDMKNPDDITYTLMIDLLGKSCRLKEAELMFSEFMNSGLEPSVKVYCALICAYAKSGNREKAEESFVSMIKSGINADSLVYTVMIDTYIRSNLHEKAMSLYYDMVHEGFKPETSLNEGLIDSCMRNGILSEGAQVFSDMCFRNWETPESLRRKMVKLYCKMGFPETAHHMILPGDDELLYCDLITAYGNVKKWQNSEAIVEILMKKPLFPNGKIWTALIHAYAQSGCYERARAAFNSLIKKGCSPSVDSVNGLLKALIIDNRLQELYFVVDELQDMGITIKRTSILIILEAFVKSGDVFETKKIHAGMRAVGYYPTAYLYRLMMGLYCRKKQIRDAEMIFAEANSDMFIWNSLLKLYSLTGEFGKLVETYRRMTETSMKPDEETYNVLIVMYCRNRQPDEGLLLLREMRRVKMEPKVDTYTSLVSALGKKKQVKKAEELFEYIVEKQRKVDRTFYHAMMKIYRDTGNHSKAEGIVRIMKEEGIEPNLSTMHLLMAVYGSSRLPEESEAVLKDMINVDASLTTLPFCSAIDAYLRSGEYHVAMQKLEEMKSKLAPDHRVFTCFVRAASLCEKKDDAVSLLAAVKDAGFDIPLRIFTQSHESLFAEMEDFLEGIIGIPDNSALNFVNAVQDLLWAFELRATATWVFDLAKRKNIYRRDLFRVAENDWSADFRKLSSGAALVGLTLWLQQMQGASLEGVPGPPKSVGLVTGTAEYNSVSVSGTLKAFLWEMGSPFLPCKARSGIYVAKSHSLMMWLKNSKFCFDLELRDGGSLPEANTMQMVDGCFIRKGFVSAYKEIRENLGFVWPKKFSQLALLPPARRRRVIQTQLENAKRRDDKRKMEFENVKPNKMKKYVRQTIQVDQ